MRVSLISRRQASERPEFTFRRSLWGDNLKEQKPQKNVILRHQQVPVALPQAHPTLPTHLYVLIIFACTNGRVQSICAGGHHGIAAATVSAAVAKPLIDRNSQRTRIGRLASINAAIHLSSPVSQEVDVRECLRLVAAGVAHTQYLYKRD